MTEIATKKASDKIDAKKNIPLSVVTIGLAKIATSAPAPKSTNSPGRTVTPPTIAPISAIHQTFSNNHTRPPCGKCGTSLNHCAIVPSSLCNDSIAHYSHLDTLSIRPESHKRNYGLRECAALIFCELDGHMPQADHTARTKSAIVNSTAHHPTGSETFTPRSPILSSTLSVTFAHTDRKIHIHATEIPAYIPTHLISGLSCIRRRNGNANTSSVTIRPASSVASTAPPGSQKLCSSGINFSKPYNCPTAISTNNPAYTSATIRTFSVLGSEGGVVCTNKLMPTIIALKQKCCYFHHYACAFANHHVLLRTAKVTKTNIQTPKKICVAVRSTITHHNRKYLDEYQGLFISKKFLDVSQL